MFAYFCIPKTKGLSLEQSDLLYQHSSPVFSANYRRELIAKNMHVADITGEYSTSTGEAKGNQYERRSQERVEVPQKQLV